MGGMIAQEFALQYPRRVRSLILGCTAAGGPTALQAEPEVLEVLMRRDLNPDASVAAIRPFIYDSATPPERLDEDTVIRKQWWPNPVGYMAQLQGIAAWEAYSRLPQISAPTLVIHGETDRLIPPGNARLIADRIRGAKLMMIPRAGHIFPTDQPDRAHNAVREFLAAQSDRKLSTPA
jgi:pimeloyl-ACP methyl ester carboxylesterase